MREGFDTTELKELADILKDLGDGKMDQFMKEILPELALRLESFVKPLTPVDKGLLRRSWQIGRVEKRGNVYEIDFFNNTEYASHVEYGHETKAGTKVEGAYMLTMGEKKLEEILIPLMEARMVAYIERILGGG